MSVSKEDIKKLWGKAGGQCSMPHCTKSLAEKDIMLGEMAHIIARSPGGPRGANRSGEDSYENLILLCPTHHTMIDSNPEQYPAERLLRIKAQHEQWVQKCLETPFNNTTEGYLLVFCGASSVGKDVVASRIRRYLARRIGVICDFLDKYTTRDKRGETEGLNKGEISKGNLYEPSSRYTFLTPDEIVKHADVFFLYKKYQKHLYGFSKKHLESKLKEDRILGCILGALDRIQEFRQEIEEFYRRRVFVILLEADKDELFSRLDLRSSLTEAEKERRREEIEMDIDRISAMRKGSPNLLDFFDLVIDNGVDSVLCETVCRAGQGIAQWLEWIE